MKEIKPETKIMDKEEQDRGHYYRAIARHFVLRRGAPFLLSPREIDLIARWESASIPLSVVLEGIDRSVEKAKRRRRPLASFSLILCDGEVQRAYAQYRDRLVGATERAQVKDKHGDILKAVENFLQQLPANLASLESIFLQAVELIKKRNKQERESQLEDLEEALEGELVAAASPEETQQVRAWMEKNFPEITGAEKDEIFKTALIKLMREKYRVPHLLTCYY